MSKRTPDGPKGGNRPGRGGKGRSPHKPGGPKRGGSRPPKQGHEGDDAGQSGAKVGRPERGGNARGAGPRGPAAGAGKPRKTGRGTGRDRGAGEGGPRKHWEAPGRKERSHNEGDLQARRPFRTGERSNRLSLPNPANDGLVRLNKYLAQAGVGSRREADVLIASGTVTVNGKVVTELGTKVKPEDIIHFGGEKLRIEQKRYVLLNKPKDTITTTSDPQERHTVMSLIAKACSERLYPVGRLDRNTTGVLLLTNDGDLAKKLTHPSYGASKLYHATLDRALTVDELHRLVEGLELEDGPAKADEVSFVGASKREVGLSIHIGRNRIVRRMFEALGAEVVKLDRVMFAGLTKKELTRGHWRHLDEKEVTWLKQMKAPPKGGKEDRGGRRTRLSQGSE